MPHKKFLCCKMLQVNEVLGSCWLHCRWQRWGLQATSSDRAEARPHLHVGHYGIHYPWAARLQTFLFALTLTFSVKWDTTNNIERWYVLDSFGLSCMRYHFLVCLLFEPQQQATMFRFLQMRLRLMTAQRSCHVMSCHVWLLGAFNGLRITGKLPGYLSPSAGLKFADVPNGLAAISKVPAAGWGQILAYMAFCEVSQDQSPGTPAAAGDFGFKVLTSSDPAEKTKKLSAELANGRLAMMAIIGMFFQDRNYSFQRNCCPFGWQVALHSVGFLM